MKYDINKDKEELANKVFKYVRIILDEYQDKIPNHIKDYLNSTFDYQDLIKIENTNTISLFVRDGYIYLPPNAYKIIELMESIPGFGINKNHKTHNNSNMIINNNTFSDYIKHVFLKGHMPIDYFLEILLHETMHLCGADGGSALKEGFTELKTRELAKKYNLTTSCCAYPKEMKIAYLFEMILGRDIADKLTFMHDEREIYYMIHDLVGREEADLYIKVSRMMQVEFQNYINKKYDGITGPIKKTLEYDKINYKKIDELFDSYYKAKEEKRIKLR